MGVSISENNEGVIVTHAGSRNRGLGNISLNDKFGVEVTNDCTTSNNSSDSVCVDSTLIDNVSINSSVKGHLARSCVNTIIQNTMSIGSSGNGIEFLNTVDSDVNGGCSPGIRVNPSYTLLNSLSLNNGNIGVVVNHSSDFSSPRVIDYVVSFGNVTDFGTGTTQKTNSNSNDPNNGIPGGSQVGTGVGQCSVYIPNGNTNLKGRGRGGEDIGANIVFRYVNGALTSTKLWNQTSGRFPCGATVVGVNDTAGDSCINMHQRLNVGVNGCPIP